ncbi:DUF1778 domain-containing protein [Streptomyces sp. NPDC092296]|uniref:type II toxin-antitoxin system TacA family antitoxin n=1 Tax=Streptomyces sp. NPDC092296 TaxID=3366012 RepID=UPI0038309A18
MDVRLNSGQESVGRRPKDQRFEMRLSREDDALITEAAALAGVSRTELGTAAIVSYAKDVIADYRATQVSAEEFARILASLDGPPEPNERIRRAARELRDERTAQE